MHGGVRGSRTAWCASSIGLEDLDDLLEDFDRALEKV